MALIVSGLNRKFKFNDEQLSDPNPDFTPEEVLAFYSVQHPELTTATIAGPEIEDGTAIYTFKTTVGTKG